MLSHLAARDHRAVTDYKCNRFRAHFSWEQQCTLTRHHTSWVKECTLFSRHSFSEAECTRFRHQCSWDQECTVVHHRYMYIVLTKRNRIVVHLNRLYLSIYISYKSTLHTAQF